MATHPLCANMLAALPFDLVDLSDIESDLCRRSSGSQCPEQCPVVYYIHCMPCANVLVGLASGLDGLSKVQMLSRI